VSPNISLYNQAPHQDILPLMIRKAVEVQAEWIRVQNRKAVCSYLSSRLSEVAGDALWATEEGTYLSVAGA